MDYRKEITINFSKSIDYILFKGVKKSKKEISELLELPNSRLSEIIRGRMNVQLDTIKILNERTGVRFDFLFKGELPIFESEIDVHLSSKNDVHLTPEKGKQSYTKEVYIDVPTNKGGDVPLPPKNTQQSYTFSGTSSMPKVITVDHSDEENILFVPVKASAGYQIGLGDPEYIETLPTFNIPNLQSGTFRAFEVQGDSMYQFGGGGLFPNDIVVANFVENPLHIRDNRVYVVVTKDDVLVKRCINRIESSGKLILNSDNKEGNYPPIVLHPSEVVEVWEFKARISRQIPANTVADEVIEIKAQLAIIQDHLSKK